MTISMQIIRRGMTGNKIQSVHIALDNEGEKRAVEVAGVPGVLGDAAAEEYITDNYDLAALFSKGKPINAKDNARLNRLKGKKADKLSSAEVKDAVVLILEELNLIDDNGDIR